MQEYIANISSFPTIVFTVILGVVIIYWLLSVLGAVDIDSIDIDIDSDVSGISGLAGYMFTFGLSGVPFSIVISFWSLYSWLASYFASEYLLGFLPSGMLYLIGASAVLLVCFFIAVPLVAISIKPLKGIFITHLAVKKEDLVGRSCVVRTQTVTDDFGQGELHDGEAGLILAIRADVPNEIVKGDKVVIISYNNKIPAFYVVTEAEFLG